MSALFRTSRLRHAALLVGSVAMFASALVVTVHLRTGDHCDPGHPDHQCDVCLAMDGNPAVPAILPDVPRPRNVTVVGAPAIPGARWTALRLPLGRAPPVTVRSA